MIYSCKAFFMSETKLVILDVDFLNVNLSHYREFRQKHRLSLSQFGFLSISKRFQDYDSHGWCEPGHGNGFDFVTGLKNYIGWCIGQDPHTTNKMFKTLVNKGFILVDQDQKRYRVTKMFEIMKSHTAKTEGITDTPPPMAERKPRVDVLEFSKVTFFQTIEFFTIEVKKLCPNLPANLDYQGYLNGFREYYQNLSGKVTYAEWQKRVKTYIEKGRQEGKLKLTEAPKALNKDAIFEGLRKWKARIETPIESDPNYRGNVLSFLDFATKAEKQNWLNEEQLDYVSRMRMKVNNDKELRAYRQSRLQKTTTEGASEVKTPQNTEGSINIENALSNVAQGLGETLAKKPPNSS
jgi:hypothetical protein